MVSPVSTRRPCFMGEDDGLASIAEFSGNSNHANLFFSHHNQPFLCYNGGGIMMRRRNSLRNISSLSSPVSPPPPPSSSSSSSSPCPSIPAVAVYSPRSGRFFDARFDEIHSPHFLESCFLCKKPLGGHRDIFMYRGDTPFCSEECRQEQMEIDEAKEKNWNLKALRSKKESNKSASSTSSSSSPTKTQNYPFRTGTVAAA